MTDDAAAGPVTPPDPVAQLDDAVAARLRDPGLGHIGQRPTVPGGPILVIGQRPPGQHRPA